MHCTTEPTTLLPSAVVLAGSVILVIWGLVETSTPVLAHPAHHRLPRRLVIGCSLLLADAAAAYLMIRGSFITGCGVGVVVGTWAWFGAGKLENSCVLTKR